MQKYTFIVKISDRIILCDENKCDRLLNNRGSWENQNVNYLGRLLESDVATLAKNIHKSIKSVWIKDVNDNPELSAQQNAKRASGQSRFDELLLEMIGDNPDKTLPRNYNKLDYGGRPTNIQLIT